nr:hypothetical protein [Acidobacteriota bacterium]
LKISIGVDLAYSKRSSADWSVAVALGYDDARDLTYVLDVLRMQAQAPVFADALKGWRTRWPGSRMHAYLGGTELGVADFFKGKGVPLSVTTATADKLVRAQPASDAWNAGRVLLPGREQPDGTVASPEWVDVFASELLDISGVNDEHDDQMDAFAAAFDARPISRGAVVQPRGVAPPHERDDRLVPARPGWRPGQGRLPNRHG